MLEARRRALESNFHVRTHRKISIKRKNNSAKYQFTSITISRRFYFGFLRRVPAVLNRAEKWFRVWESIALIDGHVRERRQPPSWGNRKVDEHEVSLISAMPIRSRRRCGLTQKRWFTISSYSNSRFLIHIRGASRTIWAVVIRWLLSIPITRLNTIPLIELFVFDLSPNTKNSPFTSCSGRREGKFVEFFNSIISR